MSLPMKDTPKEIEAKAKRLLEGLGYELIPSGYIKCLGTGRVLSIKQPNFYQTNNPMYKHSTTKTDDGEVSFLPYSKKWIEETYKNLRVDAKDNEKLAMYKMCMMLQIPWNEAHWQTAKDNKMNTLKYYIGKMNSLPQLSCLTMNDSEDYIGDKNSTFSDDSSIVEKGMKKRERKEALLRWGNNWNEFELQRLEEFYHSMKAVNKIETPQDEDYLKKLARLSVKIDDAIESGESSKAKQLGDLYSKYMSDSQFRAMDMSDADKQGGIRTFSQIYQEVESEEFIPPWEKYAKFLKVKQDLVDRTIMHLQNFILRFNGAQRIAQPPNNTPKIEGDLDE